MVVRGAGCGVGLSVTEEEDALVDEVVVVVVLRDGGRDEHEQHEDVRCRRPRHPLLPRPLAVHRRRPPPSKLLCSPLLLPLEIFPSLDAVEIFPQGRAAAGKEAGAAVLGERGRGREAGA